MSMTGFTVIRQAIAVRGHLKKAIANRAIPMMPGINISGIWFRILGENTRIAYHPQPVGVMVQIAKKIIIY